MATIISKKNKFIKYLFLGGFELTNFKNNNIRKYNRNHSIVFLKTKEANGWLSNMATGFPINVNGFEIRTVEALYQACRFPNNPDIQKQIIDQKSPMAAKMVSKKYRMASRPDWEIIKVDVMRWCIKLKLYQNWQTLKMLFKETGNLPIVEESYKDTFWGAKPINERELVGINALGRLLMQLREEFINYEDNDKVTIEAPNIENLKLYDEIINTVIVNLPYFTNNEIEDKEETSDFEQTSFDLGFDNTQN